LDIIQRPHNLVIDCISPKSVLYAECDLETALQIMQKEQTDVLPVYNKDRFEGLLFKSDILEFLMAQNTELENKVQERTELLRKSTENIKASEQVLKALFNSTQSVIFLVSSEYEILFFNKKAYDNSLILHQKEIKIGDNIIDYITDTENNIYKSFRSEFERALNDEYVIVEKEIKYTEESSIWFKTEYFPVYENDRTIGVAIIITDINEKKKYELRIRKQNEMLQEIAWIQSHKNRQPIATILGLMSLIQKSELTESNKEIFEMLESKTRELDQIIHEIVSKTNSINLDDEIE
jgi:PAS domain S-box-containing protein